MIRHRSSNVQGRRRYKSHSPSHEPCSAINQVVVIYGMEIEVNFGTRYQLCTLAGAGRGKFCHQVIVWATTGRGRFVPLEPDDDDEGDMAPHFDYCQRRFNSQPPPPPRFRAGAPPQGIEIDQATWKQLLKLTHPDKHHGGEDERLATTVTQWLLEQRPKLRKRRAEIATEGVTNVAHSLRRF